MRLLRFSWACVFTLLVVAQVCDGGEGDFKVGVRDEEIPEAGSVTYTTLATTLNEFAFLPPPRWKREIDPKSRTILLTSHDFLSTIRVLFPDQNSEAVPVLKAEDLRQALLAEMAGARIVEESPGYTSGLAGLAFDAERVIASGVKVRSRDAFFAVAGGTVRITLSAPADHFDARQSDLSRFLNSFKTNQRTP